MVPRRYAHVFILEVSEADVVTSQFPWLDFEPLPHHVSKGAACAGDGPMPEGSRLLLPELKLRVKTSGGVLVFFDTKTMLHGTEAGEPCGAGEAARMGIALHCKSNVSAIPLMHSAQKVA